MYKFVAKLYKYRIKKKIAKTRLKSACIKWTFGLFGNYYRDSTLPKSYLIIFWNHNEKSKIIGQLQINEKS